MTIVHIDRIAQGGEGVGKLPDGRVCFVPRALPGDEVRIVVETSKKRWARARLEAVVSPSPLRRPSGCRHFEVCGGCTFQELDYADELRLKVEAARDVFGRIFRAPPVDGEVVPAPSVEGYRIRTRFASDGAHLGFRGRRSHDVFDLDACPILDARLQRAIAPLRELARGHVGEVAVETAGDDAVAVLLSGELAHLGAPRWASRVVAPREIWGRDVPIEVPPGRFRQANGPLTARLREVVAGRVGAGSSLVELYAGSGALTIAVADAFAAVVAYEVDALAVEVGNRAFAALGLEHVRFEHADLEELAWGRVHDDDVVLLDPPRTGARSACELIALHPPRRVVYVSCDVPTLARDCMLLSAGGLELTSLDFLDMFPRTHHLEAVATLRRG